MTVSRWLLLWIAAAAALAADPAAVETRKARARSLIELENFTAALQEAQAINRAMPDDVSAYQLMASAQLGLGDYAGAEKQLQWMLDLRIGKADLEGWLLVARFREVTGDLEGALDAVNLANGVLLGGPEAERRSLLVYAGRLYCGLGKLDLAKQSVDAAIAGGDSEPAAREVLARIHLAQGNHEEAARVLRSAARTSDPRVLYLLAEISGAASAYAAFEHAALQVSGSFRNSNRELALYYAGPGRRPARALEIARRESGRRQDVFTLDALAVALFANHQTVEARDVMRRVLAVGIRDAAILRHAARVGVKTP